MKRSIVAEMIVKAPACGFLIAKNIKRSIMKPRRESLSLYPIRIFLLRAGS
jgi:hypothetical protein